MNTKLTLTIEQEVIERAKKLCERQKSQFIGYYRKLFKTTRQRRKKTEGR